MWRSWRGADRRKRAAGVRRGVRRRRERREEGGRRIWGVRCRGEIWNRFKMRKIIMRSLKRKEITEVVFVSNEF
jgi:hypothetical protein